MRIGKMDNKIELQRKATTQSATGAPLDIWTTYAEPFARLEYKDGREFNAADQTNAEDAATFVIWWRSDVTTRDRVLFRNQQWDIHSVRPGPQRKHTARLVCTAVAD